MANSSLTANLLNLVNANNGLSSLFSTTPSSFGNPLALAATAQAVLDFNNQFPSEQALALSGLFMQLTALNAAATPLIVNPAATIPGLSDTTSPVLPADLYHQTSASSSNTTAVGVTSKAGATLTSYQVEVSQLGAAQVATGTALSSTAATAINSGTIEINVPGVAGGSNAAAFANAKYTIVAGEDNQTALTAIAEAINSVTANNLIQTVSVGNASSGTFKLTVLGQTTSALSFNDSAANVQAALQTALNALPGATGSDVTVTKTGMGTYTIGFHGFLDGHDVPVMSAVNVDLSSGATVAVAPYAGLTATVTNSGGNSTLSVAANSAGTANSFSLTDTAGNGINQAFALGAGTSVGPTGTGIATAAADTIYSVNGASYALTSGSSATIDGGKVTLTFGTTTSSPATVTISSDTSGLAGSSSTTGAITNLVTAYNNLQDYLSTNSLFITPSLAQQAEAIITSSVAGLTAVGITGNTSLAVDQTTLSAASASALRQTFSGPNGVATQVAGLAQTVLTSLAQGFAAAAQPPANSSTVATGLAAQFEQVLLAGEAGTLFSVKA